MSQSWSFKRSSVELVAAAGLGVRLCGAGELWHSRKGALLGLRHFPRLNEKVFPRGHFDF